MSIRSYFMAKFYDSVMQNMEKSCLSTWRSELLSEVRGNILEIGSGTGVNLPYYPKSIDSLVFTEPDPHMLTFLIKKVSEKSNKKFRVEGFSADNLDFPDHSFDAIVTTLVLCSVESPENTLKEIKRVLKPNGKLYFLEHVLAKKRPNLIKWQKFFHPAWKCMCGNCHLTRDTEKYISDAGFHFEQIEYLKGSGAPRIVSPIIKGIATV
ncbi:MAG: ubiquinone/menaquinone biosynthesis C-methylase UbiE [bacterium]|jgi:ubiquinone/menaquinone biosynthesis C-methylase UbiE